MLASYAIEIITLSVILTAVFGSTVFAFATSLVLAAVESRFIGYRKSFAAIFLTLSLYSPPIGIVAYVAGLLTTASRASAVGNLIPAVLGLIGGLNIYIFGSGNKNKLLVGYCVTLFTVMLLYGAQYGAYRRETDRVARFEELTRQELQIRILRKSLGLPDEIPGWMTSSEPKS